jgi:hypothetical protein
VPLFCTCVATTLFTEKLKKNTFSYFYVSPKCSKPWLGKLKGQDQTGRNRCRWKDDIKKNLWERDLEGEN